MIIKIEFIGDSNYSRIEKMIFIEFDNNDYWV